MTRLCVKGVIRTLVLLIVSGPLSYTPVAAADKLLTLYTARVMSQAYPWMQWRLFCPAIAR
jgi:hypothetical protein